MINPNELRINNLVYGVSDRIEVVVELKEKFAMVQLPKKMIDDRFDCEYKYLSPIPLTEEMLIKCGFEKHPHVKNTYILLAGLGAILIDDSSVMVNKVRIPHIKWLHQIQNLYYMIQGQEINITI